MKPFKKLTMMYLEAQELIEQLRANVRTATKEVETITKERDELRLGVEKLQAELRPPRPDLSGVMPGTPMYAKLRQGINGSTLGS